VAPGWDPPGRQRGGSPLKKNVEVYRKLERFLKRTREGWGVGAWVGWGAKKLKIILSTEPLMTNLFL